MGNLNALRDWGYALDYVECLWLILQQDKPDDYVVAMLLGDPTKAKAVLGRNPTKTSFDDLVKLMMKHDMQYVLDEKHIWER